MKIFSLRSLKFFKNILDLTYFNLSSKNNFISNEKKDSHILIILF